MNKVINRCNLCGRDTGEADWEYLIGEDHLGCTLQWESEVGIPVKVRGWEKLNGMGIGPYTLNGGRREGETTLRIWGWSEGIYQPTLEITLEGGKWMEIRTEWPEKGWRSIRILRSDLATPQALLTRIRREWE